MYVTLILFAGGVLLTAGDIVFKFWVTRPQPVLYIGGLLLYVLGAMLLIQTYKTENIAVATAIFILFNIITLAFFSWLYFKEPLNALQIVGLLFAAAAILCLELAS